jgi:hypothetical protein
MLRLLAHFVATISLIPLSEWNQLSIFECIFFFCHHHLILCGSQIVGYCTFGSKCCPSFLLRTEGRTPINTHAYYGSILVSFGVLLVVTVAVSTAEQTN